MRVTRVTVNFGSTTNLGNYSSARFDVSFEAELDEGEDHRAACAELHKQAREEVRRQALPVIRRAKANLEEIVRHLPEDLQAAIYQHQQQNGERE